MKQKIKYLEKLLKSKTNELNAKLIEFNYKEIDSSTLKQILTNYQEHLQIFLEQLQDLPVTAKVFHKAKVKILKARIQDAQYQSEELLTKLCTKIIAHERKLIDKVLNPISELLDQEPTNDQSIKHKKKIEMTKTMRTTKYIDEDTYKGKKNYDKNS